jgi:hypothetical protein
MSIEVAMPYSTTVQGKIVIGSGDKAIPIPISTKLSPGQGGGFVFDYTADKPEEGTHLGVKEFADWVGKNIGPGVFDTSALPPNLQAAEVALKTLHLETTGNKFELVVLVGSTGGEGGMEADR